MKSGIWKGALVVTIALLSLAGVSAQEEEQAPDSRESDATATSVAASTMKIKLRNGEMELTGTPIDLETITVNSLFGEAKLPMHTVAGVRFAQSENEQTTIVLQNGDVITGELGMEHIKLVSEWGEATVRVPHIETIVFRSDLAWTPVSTGGGTRWRLTKIRSSSTGEGARFFRQGSN